MDTRRCILMRTRFPLRKGLLARASMQHCHPSNLLQESHVRYMPHNKPRTCSTSRPLPAKPGSFWQMKYTPLVTHYSMHEQWCCVVTAAVVRVGSPGPMQAHIEPSVRLAQTDSTADNLGAQARHKLGSTRLSCSVVVPQC